MNYAEGLHFSAFHRYYRGQCVIILQAAVVREMKSQGASKEAIDVEVKKLLGLKEKLGVSPAAAKGKKGKKNKAPK